MEYGTTVIPADGLIAGDLEKQAFAPVLAAALPLIGKAVVGALTAHGIYSGAKNIAKGNYGSGAMDLAFSLPFVGWAGKGLKATGMLARMAGRAGRFGNLGTRFRAMGGAARTAAEPTSAVGRWWNAAKGGVDRAYQGLGSGFASQHIGTLPQGFQPYSKWFRESGRMLGSAGRSIEGVGRAIGNTRYGKFVNSPLGIGAMVAAPMLIGASGEERQPQPTDYAHPTLMAGNLLNQYGPGLAGSLAMRQQTPLGMPQGFSY